MSPNSSKPNAIKESGFLSPKAWKRCKKEDLGGKKPVLEQK